MEAIVNCALEQIHVDVVIGAQHPRRDDLEAMCGRQAFASHVEPSGMADLMCDADLAIGAGIPLSVVRRCAGRIAARSRVCARSRGQLCCRNPRASGSSGMS